MNFLASKNIVKFWLPASSQYYCIMVKAKETYTIKFYHEGKLLKTLVLADHEMIRENLRKHAVATVGINFYSLSGPYDVADAILQHYHNLNKKKRRFGIF